MDWKHIMNIASGHSSLVVRTPYPIVCWVSIENRKHDVNVKMLDTHGIQPFSAENKFSCWNLHNFKSRHIGTTSGEKNPSIIIHGHWPWCCGKCISSKSPCVNAISHQMTANANHERKKLNANTSNVQRHCESTKVVKMSCRKRIRRWAIFFWITLHSPFLSTARRRIFLELPGRYPRLLGKINLLNVCAF